MIKLLSKSLVIASNSSNVSSSKLISSINMIGSFDVVSKDLNYYINEYDKIYKSLLKTTNLPIIFVDEIILNDDTFEELDAMTKLFKSNLIILTFVKR